MRVSVGERTASIVKIAEHCVIGEGTVISLRGGQLVLGEGVELRRDCQVEVRGRLEFEGRALVQRGTTLHCDESIAVGARTVLSECTTIVDSSHGTDDSDGWFLDVVRTEPVVIGTGVWVGAKATIGKGVRIGSGSVVSANSLVIKDVPPRWLVSGVPAKEIRPLGDNEHPSERILGDRPVA